MDVKFSDEKFVKKIQIYARGKGEDTEICFHYIGWHESQYHQFSIELAKKLVEFFEKAIQDAERRKLLEDEE